jgi:predicted transcriptional regulator
MKMRVRDVMSVRLLCAHADTAIQEVARTLVRNRIGGMPVVDDEGQVKGIVSESDLQPVKEGPPTRGLVTAADVMTQPVITLSEEDTVTQAARVLRRHGVKRAPVVREGRIVGMITQSDLLRPYLRTDGEIRADVEEALLGDDISGGAEVWVRVNAGVVMLDGTVRDRQQAAVLAKLAGSVDGAIDVRDLMRVAEPVR